MTDWQPIATAPKDGTEILLFWPSYAYSVDDEGEARVVIGWWGGSRGSSHFVDTYEVDCYGLARPEHHPTHWMPLPPHPQG